MPSHRCNNAAISRIMELTTLDPAKYELIVRDNSESLYKRELITHFQTSTLKYVPVSNCAPMSNASEAFKLATGEFTFFLGDDDRLPINGIEAIYKTVEENNADSSFGIATGTYLVESTSGSGLFAYPLLDQHDPNHRIASYLNEANAMNFIYYSATRTSTARDIFKFVENLPYQFSYVDLLMTLLRLTQGRALKTEQIIYHYDYSQWNSLKDSHNKDGSFYVAAGLPVEYNHLHYLFCGLEGALILDSNWVLERTGSDMSSASLVWFNHMFGRFVTQERVFAYENTKANQAILGYKKQLAKRKTFNLNELLVEICELLDITDHAGAQRYFNFWSTI